MVMQLSLMPSRVRAGGGQTTVTTFADNMKHPVHRWFRFSAGYSARWAEQEIATYRRERGEAITVMDPFAGVGTTLLAADACGVPSYGLEAQPFLARIARAKLGWDADVNAFTAFARRVYESARHGSDKMGGYPRLIQRCFPEGTLAVLDALRRAWSEHNDGSIYAELTWLAITAILRATSPVGTAHMELIQPRKSKKYVAHPLEAFEAQVRLMAEDMRAFQRYALASSSRATLFREDARICARIPEKSVHLVITSPPYLNNFDYADATRFEMSFWGEVKRWADLHEIRKSLVVSCSHHARASRLRPDALLQSEALHPIRAEITHVYRELAAQRLHRGGRKNYHLMVVGYFFDMAKVWQTLRKVCVQDARVCFVVGDSAPYGVHIPVEKWLGELALAAGFRNYRFEKVRDRNTKWRNRKHRVPLHEGFLWVRG